MSAAADFARGCAQLAASAGAGTWEQSGSGGTIERGTLDAGVDQGVGIQTYSIGPDDPQHPTGQRRVQFWLRAPDQASMDDLAQVIYDAFDGLTDVDMGSVHVTQMLLLSDLPQGVDGRGRLERSVNFTADLDLQPTALRSY